MKTIHEVANLSGVSVRTLQYYDKIGLLTPDYYSSSGYRQYSSQNLLDLQKILIYKTLDFSLADIKSLMSKTLDEQAQLQQQKSLLILKQKQLTDIITWIDRFSDDNHTVDFEAFKNTVTLNLPFTLSDTQKDLITLETYEKLKKLWGEAPLRATEQLFSEISLDTMKEISAHSFELQKSILDTPDDNEAMKRLEVWLNFEQTAYQLTNSIIYAQLFVETFHKNPEQMNLLEQQFGAESAQRLLILLEEYIHQN